MNVGPATRVFTHVKLCAIPPGIVSPDTYRLSEALEAGCIPIIPEEGGRKHAVSQTAGGQGVTQAAGRERKIGRSSEKKKSPPGTLRRRGTDNIDDDEQHLEAALPGESERSSG
jgi:hypothetical protein